MGVLGGASVTPVADSHPNKRKEGKEMIQEEEEEEEGDEERTIEMNVTTKHVENLLITPDKIFPSSSSSVAVFSSSSRIKEDNKRETGYDDQQQVVRKRKRDTNSVQKKKRNYHVPPSPSPSCSTSGESSAMSDSVGHHSGEVDSIIHERYQIKKEIGMGTFGKVFLCHDHKHKDVVALKAVRSIKRYVDSAKIEADILDHVYDCQAKQRVNSCLKLYSHFELNDHYFLVTEKLGPSLYDVLKRNKYKGFPMRTIRSISRQLLEAMRFLKSMNLVHTDLKVENVLFVEDYEESDSSRRSERYPASSAIKIIDFGGATYDDERKSTIVNTRQYRSPEVLLEAGWSFASDIWSVGCIIGEIYTGGLFFQTHDNLEHLSLIERTCGLFPYRLLKDSPISRKYFDSGGRCRLSELSRDSQDHVRGMMKLRDVFSLGKDKRDRSGIADTMKELLEIDPGRRISATEALQMPFLK